MALGDPYATVAELKTYLRITDTTDDALLTDSLATASRLIDHHCGRQFNKTTSATARVFWTAETMRVNVDDFHTITNLVIATSAADDGTYGQTLTTADYDLYPPNGVVAGESGWPFYRIHLTQSQFTGTRRPQVQVTAQWGWTAVPAAIKRAAVQIGEEIYKLKGAPFGIAASDQFGPIRVRDNPRVMAMLAPYRIEPVQMA